jgi:hypothetical protein
MGLKPSDLVPLPSPSSILCVLIPFLDNLSNSYKKIFNFHMRRFDWKYLKGGSHLLDERPFGDGAQC